MSIRSVLTWFFGRRTCADCGAGGPLYTWEARGVETGKKASTRLCERCTARVLKALKPAIDEVTVQFWERPR